MKRGPLDVLPGWVHLTIGFGAGFAAGWLFRGEPPPPVETPAAQVGERNRERERRDPEGE